MLSDAVTWAVAIDQSVETFPHLAETYPASRFAYFLESVLALDALVTASTARQDKLGSARGAAVTQRDLAVKARKQLLKRLERYAWEREAEVAALGSVPALGRTNEELRQSIRKLADLGRTWLARTDAANVALAKAAGLDQAVVDKALAAAEALGSANFGATLEGRKSSNDSPVVNLEEGNVLLEMMYVMDVFDEAHEENDVVPRLVAGPATRHVLAPAPSVSAVEAAPPAGASSVDGAAPLAGNTAS